MDGVDVLVRVAGVGKVYRSRRSTVEALRGIDLEVRRGETVAVIGPSGCGKSTLLRLVASLEKATEGEIRIEGAAPAELARRHGLGVAFQEHALLPWLSAFDNVALPYKMAGRKVERDRVSALLDMVGLAGFERSLPRHLSGGMKQRVSIARSLVLEPRLLLLDEPFAAVDAVTRRKLTVEVQALIARLDVTTILVTHSVEEAVMMADRVVVLSRHPGRVHTIEPVPFARPRSEELLRDPRFHELADQLLVLLDEVSASTPGPACAPD
jgi:NitT/TauT family transport system ATP-binding protein